MFTAHDTAAALARTVPFRPFPGAVHPAATLPPGARLKSDAPVRNDLLGALPAEELARLRPRLERVALKRRQALQERNVPMSHAFFIEKGAASLLSRSGDGAFALEVGMLGRKDVAGIPIVLGTARSPHRCVVQTPGEALRIRADDLRQAMDEMPALRQLLLGYVQAALVQSAQLVVCNARHPLGERIARWLLVAHDRLDGNEICITHQAIGRALGVRRAGVTTAMGRMEEAGLLRRKRGCVVVLDQAGLEEAACDCYRIIRAEHQRLVCDVPGGTGANEAGVSTLLGCADVNADIPRDLAMQDPNTGRTNAAAARRRGSARTPNGAKRSPTRTSAFRTCTTGSRTAFRSSPACSRWKAGPARTQRPRGASETPTAESRASYASTSVSTRHPRPSRSRWTQARTFRRSATRWRTRPAPPSAGCSSRWKRGLARFPPGNSRRWALLVSELVTNAVKHAAPHDPEGDPTRVLVLLEPDGDGLARLTVFDTGPGLPAGFDPKRPTGLGMRLVASFARQLGGVLEIARGGGGSGARFAVSFPLGR